jgi:hypothetical protein
MAKVSSIQLGHELRILIKHLKVLMGFSPEFGLERFIDKFNEKISIITPKMKSYTFSFLYRRKHGQQ